MRFLKNVLNKSKDLKAAGLFIAPEHCADFRGYLFIYLFLDVFSPRLTETYNFSFEYYITLKLTSGYHDSKTLIEALSRWKL